MWTKLKQNKVAATETETLNEPRTTKEEKELSLSSGNRSQKWFKRNSIVCQLSQDVEEFIDFHWIRVQGQPNAITVLLL